MKQNPFGGVINDILVRDKNEQERLAMEFSEGSENFRKLLLQLWKHGIQTGGSCSGILEEHDPNVHYCTHAYISIKLTEECRDILERFIVILKENKFDERFVISIESRTIPYADILVDWDDACNNTSGDTLIVLRMASLRKQINDTKKFTRQECEDWFYELYKAFVEDCNS